MNKVSKSSSNYIAEMHHAGYNSVHFMGHRKKIEVVSYRYYGNSCILSDIKFMSLSIENYFGGLVYTHSNNEDILLLTKNKELDIKAISIFELQKNDLYKAIEGENL